MKTKQLPSEPTLAEAQQLLDEVACHRAQLTAALQELNNRLESTQRSLGHRYLDGDRAGLQEVIEFRAEIDAVQSALAVLDERDRAARFELEAATARDLRARAARKSAELAELNNATGKLLAQLSQLERVDFTHSILACQPIPGKWNQLGKASPDPWLGFWERLTPEIPGQINMETPRSRTIMLEIEGLELKATEIEQLLSREMSLTRAA